MNNKFLKLVGVFVSVMLLMVVSCKDDDPINTSVKPNPNKGEDTLIRGYEKTTKDEIVKMKPNVIYVTKEINKDLEKLDEKNNIAIYKENELTKHIDEGDVLYSRGTGDFSDAYAIKVEKITRSNGKIKCEYRQATITEVFEKLHEKQKFKTEKKGIEGYDIEKYLEYLKKRKRPATRSGSGSGIPFLDEVIEGMKLKDGDSNGKFELEVEKGKIKMTSVIWDKDKDYKNTKNDQIRVTIKYEPKEPSIISDFEWGKLTCSGSNDFDLDVTFSYGYENDNRNDNLKEKLEKHNKDIQNEVKKIEDKLRHFLKPTSDKVKMMIASMELTGKSLTNLAVKPVLKFYLVLETDMKGNFKINIETKYTLSHIIELNATKKNISVDLADRDKNFSVEGDISTDIKFGPGVALDLEFPAFKREEEDGEKKNSLIGISAEAYLKGEIKGEAKFNYNTNAKKNSVAYFKVSTKGNLEWEPSVYGKFGFWGYNKTLTYEFEDAPYSILKGLSYYFGFYLLPPNEEESFDVDYNSNVDIDNYDENVVIAKFEKDEIKLTGNNKGFTHISFSDNTAMWRKADVLVTVLGNDNNYTPSKPDLIIPIDNNVFDKDTPITLKWRKSIDKDNILRYDVYIRNPKSSEFEKVKTLYESKDKKEYTYTYDFTPKYTGTYSWKIVARDGQVSAGSDVFRFTIKDNSNNNTDNDNNDNNDNTDNDNNNSNNVTIETYEASNVSYNSANLKLKLSTTKNISEVGFVWGLSSSPTTDDNFIKLDVAEEVNYLLSNLETEQKYYVRGYVKTDKGTKYGNEISFTTTRSAVGGTYVGNITLASQEQVEEFAKGGYMEIEGKLTICDCSNFKKDDEHYISDLSPLIKLHTLTGTLHIKSYGKGTFKNLKGLDNLSLITGNLIIDNQSSNLKSLEGLEGLLYVNGEVMIINDWSIKDLCPLTNLAKSDLDIKPIKSRRAGTPTWEEIRNGNCSYK